MQALFNAQNLVVLVLSVAVLATEIYCLVDALRYPQQAYTAAGKLTKTWWLIILGVATALGFISLGGLAGIGLLGVVAFGVYLADVRPALRAVTPRKRKGASGNGPYGSW